MDRSLSPCFALAAALLPAAAAFAHGGGLDRHGCHHDRKRGGYHCHRAPASGASPARAEARYAPGNNLTGYVIPQRGAFENWYPYPFLDITQIGAFAVTMNCLGIGLAFLILAAGLAALDRIFARSAAVRVRAAP